MNDTSTARRWHTGWLAAALALGLSPIAAADGPDPGPTREVVDAPCAGAPHGTVFQRTFLFFGRGSPRGPISNAAFQWFLDTSVTPLFPDGFTVLDARGQFRASAGGRVEKEDSKVVILLYPFSPAASEHIDEIRSRYKAQFAQTSVLRVDERSCVSF
jgi:hypothetical protein